MADDEHLDLDNTGLAFGIVVAAASSSAIGGVIVFFPALSDLGNKKLLAASLCFAGGVMVYVSMIEIFHKSREEYEADGFSEKDAYTLATVTFFGGMIFLFLLLRLAQKLKGARGPRRAPVEENEIRTSPQNAAEEAKEETKLKEMGLHAALAISIHNFPEGLASFVSILADPSVGWPVALAIFIHNMPEGYCVAMPIYHASGSKIRALLWASLCGFAEIVGAFFAWIILKAAGDEVGPTLFAISYGITGGLMTMMVFSEFLPTAYRLDPDGVWSMCGLFAGMVVMAISLCIEKY